ncbi:glycosyltransferase [Pseudomonas cucumis]|uniref:glycosyltransferase n=1 Tax=Pseudomonas cucumis TaxID=2954082 RepID=UPI002734D989|nr:glycosyltransferase [Pseudomonas cucumis]WLG88974.1 glycosyltransferase [Pseudomonas cucumis]
MLVKPIKVAILLAAYNGMSWIEEQVTSILDQQGVGVTLFISVDPSTDGTEAWCADLSANQDRVRLLPAVEKYGGAARNFYRLMRDVDLDSFDFVAFSDQDDIWSLDKLARATDILMAGQYDAYSSNVTAFWPDGRTLLLNKAQPQVTWDFMFEAAGPGCTYVFSRALAVQLKRSMLANWEQLQRVSLHDWYCYAFARSHQYQWFIDPVPSMRYRQHERNQVGANTGLSTLIARYKTIHDGWWFNQVRLIAQLVGLGADPFVVGWSGLGRWQLLKLSLSASKCRRRLRDKVLFFFTCWLTSLIGSNAK